MKNILWGIGTSVMGSFAFHWISNGPKINIPSDVWVIFLWAIPAFLIYLFVLFLTLPRMVRGFVRWRKDMGRAARDEELEHF